MLFYFYFVMSVRKKIVFYLHLQLNLAPTPIRASAPLAGPPLPVSERTYFMDDPQIMLIILLHVR